MNLTKFLRNTLIVIGVLIIGIVFLLCFNFNKSFDFTGGTIATINAKQLTQVEAESKVRDVMIDNQVYDYSINLGSTNDDTVIVLKYQTGDNAAVLNEQIKAELFTKFNYDAGDSIQSKYVVLTENVAPVFGNQTFYNAFLAVLILGIAVAFYMLLRHNLSSAVVMLTQLIINVGLMLSLVLLFRVEITALIGIAICATAIYSIISSFIVLNNLNNATKQEKYQKTGNSEIVEIVIKEKFRQSLIVSCGFILALLLLVVVCGFSIASTVLAIILGTVVSLYTSLTILPVLWANSCKRKSRAVTQQTVVTNSDNAQV